MLGVTGEGVMARKPTDIIQLKVRMRERLRAQLEREAGRQGHSMNAEIVRRLERSFEEEKLDEKIEPYASWFEASQQQYRKILEELRRDRMQRTPYALLVNPQDLTPQQRAGLASVLNELKTDPETADLTGEETYEIIIRSRPMEEGGDGNS
jgi:hypothetical protein